MPEQTYEEQRAVRAERLRIAVKHAPKEVLVQVLLQHGPHDWLARELLSATWKAASDAHMAAHGELVAFHERPGTRDPAQWLAAHDLLDAKVKRLERADRAAWARLEAFDERAARERKEVDRA